MKNVPNWHGFMANIVHGKHLSTSKIPLNTPLDPSSYDAIIMCCTPCPLSSSKQDRREFIALDSRLIYHCFGRKIINPISRVVVSNSFKVNLF